MQVENPMVKEPSEQIWYMDIREKLQGLDKYRTMWKGMEQRENETRRTREVSAEPSVLYQRTGK